jgi:hypothetical protein
MTTPKLYGLKVPVQDLEFHKTSIENIYTHPLLALNTFTVGLDTELSKEQKPHYHIHWYDTRELECLRKIKQKIMPKWGHSTKLYPPKKKRKVDLKSDPLAWLGYAVKETHVFASEDIDLVLLGQHAHTQREFKRAKINWGEKKQEKKDEAKTLEEKLFAAVVIPTTFMPDDSYSISRMFIEMSRTYFEQTGDPCPPRSLERYTYKYLFSKKLITHDCYVFRVCTIPVVKLNNK